MGVLLYIKNQNRVPTVPDTADSSHICAMASPGEEEGGILACIGVLGQCWKHVFGMTEWIRLGSADMSKKRKGRFGCSPVGNGRLWVSGGHSLSSDGKFLSLNAYYMHYCLY